MATADPLQSTNALLSELISEVRELKDLLQNFTNDGFPLNQTVPTAELIASIGAAVALTTRTDPAINEKDLQRRLQMAQPLADNFIRFFDAYQKATRAGHLERQING